MAEPLRIPASLSPETRLLLLCAAGPQADPAIARLAAERIRWDRFSWIATQEKAVATVWPRLRQVAPEAPPPEVREQLQRIALVTEFKQTHLEQRLTNAVDVLEATGAEPVLLKGAALAIAAYGSFSQRPMADVDLLVPADRAVTAQAALVADSWTEDYGLDPSPRQIEQRRAFYLAHHHLVPLIDGQGTSLALEIHTALMHSDNPFGLPPEQIRESAIPVDWGGRTVRVPDMTHQLLHLCVHFAWSHGMRSGAWIAFRDVRTLIENGAVDWGEVVEAAHAARATSCCFWTLQLARNLTGAPVPEDVLESLRPPISAPTRAVLERHLTHEAFAAEAVCPSRAVSRWLWDQAIQPRWSGHGEVRPWRRQIAFPNRDGASEPLRGWSLISHHLQNGAVWARFARVLLRPAGSPRPTL